LELCSKWMRYKIPDDLSDELIGETVMCRSRLAYLSRNFDRITKIYEEAKGMRKPSAITKGPHTFLLQQLFQMSCMLGHWDEVVTYGKDVARFSEVRGGTPVSMMEKYHTEAMKTPQKNLNYFEIFKNVVRFKELFDRNLMPPLMYYDMEVLNFETKFVKYDNTLDDKPLTAPENAKRVDMYKLLPLDAERKRVWVFGACCQLLCPIAQLALLVTGPLDDSQMRLSGVATYQMRAAQPQPGIPPEKMNVALTLQAEKSQSKIVDTKKCWLWEGSLKILRHKGTVIEDEATKQKKYRFDMVSDRTYKVWLTTT